MSDEGYRSPATLGGKIGCAAAAIVGLPVFIFGLMLESLGDCAPDTTCHKTAWGHIFLPTILVALPVGLLVRFLVNRFRR